LNLDSPSHPYFLLLLSPWYRILLKERQKEDAAYGDKPKFITSEYKRKLMEDQKWEMEDKLADALEQRTGVAERGMHGFYSNLLTKNIAMGGDVTSSAVSAYTAGSRRQQIHLGEDEKESGGGGVREGEGDGGVAEATSIEERQSKKRPTEIEDRRESEQEDEKRRKVDPAMEQIPSPPRAVIVSPPPAPITAAVSKETLIMSAKERYLQRKIQQQQSASLEG
jgi:hypothetical protein